MTIQKIATLTAALALLTSQLSPALAQTGPTKLRFVSLAWQTQAITAVKAAVAECNASNPRVQVDYQQVSWDAVQDYLTTSFEAKSVPDVFHYESTAVMEFGGRGYLTDLSKMIPAEMKSDVAKGAWATVTSDKGAVYGVPFLWESLITLYNKDLFKQAGIKVPTSARPWTWAEFEKASKALTKDKNGDGVTDQYGSAFGLRSPTNRILNLALGFGGDYFYKSGNSYVVRVGDKEKALLKILLDMHYADKSASLDGLTAQSPELFAGFFAGKYAMLPGIGVWARQTIAESGPKNFNWGVLPPIKAATQNQGSATQTLSIPGGLGAQKRSHAVYLVLCQPQQQRQAGGGRLALSHPRFLAQGQLVSDPGQRLAHRQRVGQVPDDGSFSGSQRLYRGQEQGADADFPAAAGRPPEPGRRRQAN